MDDFHFLCEQKILVHNYIEKIMIYDKSELRFWYKYSWIWFVIYIISMIAK